MNLWNFLAMIAGCATFGASFGAALVMRRGGADPSLAAAALMGFALGAVASYALVATRRRIRSAVPLGTDGATPLWLRLLYGGAVAWVFVAAYVAYVATSALLSTS